MTIGRGSILHRQRVVDVIIVDETLPGVVQILGEVSSKFEFTLIAINSDSAFAGYDEWKMCGRYSWGWNGGAGNGKMGLEQHTR